MGALDLGPSAPSGTPGNPMVLRYYDSTGSDSEHPVNRADPGSEAVVHGVIFWGGVHDWVVHGLTLRDPQHDVANGCLHVLGQADRIVLDGNLIEDSSQKYGVRIRDSVDACVQNNVIRHHTAADEDGVGINVIPYLRGAHNVRIVANEIYDWFDAIQTGEQNGLPVSFTIDGNDLYVTPETYVKDPSTGLTYSCAENAIDIKAAGPATSRVTHNRMWGFRETPPPELYHLCGPGYRSGSAGDAIVVHYGGTNIKIEANTIGDSVHGLRASYRNGGRNLAFNWNYVYGIPAADANIRFYSGAVLVVEDDVDVISNRFASSPLICPASSWPPISWNPGPPLLSGNALIGVTSVGTCTQGINWPMSSPYTYRYWRRRLTGPEQVTLPASYR